VAALHGPAIGEAALKDSPYLDAIVRELARNEV
jgi:hypothetical protein